MKYQEETIYNDTEKHFSFMAHNDLFISLHLRVKADARSECASGRKVVVSSGLGLETLRSSKEILHISERYMQLLLLKSV